MASPCPPPERAGVPRLLLAPWPRAFPLSALHTPRRVWRAAFAAPAQKNSGEEVCKSCWPSAREELCKIPHRLLPSAFPRLPEAPAVPCASCSEGEGSETLWRPAVAELGLAMGPGSRFPPRPFPLDYFPPPSMLLFTKSSRKLLCSRRSCAKKAFSNPNRAQCEVPGPLRPHSSGS